MLASPMLYIFSHIELPNNGGQLTKMIISSSCPDWDAFAQRERDVLQLTQLGQFLYK